MKRFILIVVSLSVLAAVPAASTAQQTVCPPGVTDPAYCQTTPPGSGSNPGTENSKPKATSRINGTVGCAAKTTKASVTGKQIASVTFYLDGKKVKTLTKSSAGAFTYKRTTKNLSYGSHSLRARVTYTKASGAKARNFTLRFSRCKPRIVLPQFTG